MYQLQGKITVQVDADATRDHFGATVGGAPGLSLVSSKLTIWVTTYEPTGQTPNTTQPLNFVFGHLNVTTLKI